MHISCCLWMLSQVLKVLSSNLINYTAFACLLLLLCHFRVQCVFAIWPSPTHSSRSWMLFNFPKNAFNLFNTAHAHVHAWDHDNGKVLQPNVEIETLLHAQVRRLVWAYLWAGKVYCDLVTMAALQTNQTCLIARCHWCMLSMCERFRSYLNRRIWMFDDH